MLIWLRSPKLADAALMGVGIDGNIIRREDGARLISLEDGFAVLDEERSALDEERVELQQQMQEEAQQLYARAHQEGQEQGRQLALEEWYERTIGTLADYREIQKRMRERLAELIASAVEQIVQVEDSKGLFLRALSSLDQIVEGASFLTVSVSRQDFSAAKQVFDEFARGWSRRGQSIKIVVHPDKSLAAGSCICESEFGVVDASLQMQIQAMRAALERALQKEMSEMTPSAPNDSEQFDMDDELHAQEVALNDESDEVESAFGEEQIEQEPEVLLDETVVLQASNEAEQLATLAPSLAFEEVEVDSDVAALKKPKVVSKAKPKPKPKNAAKSASSSQATITSKKSKSNTKSKPDQEAEVKPKAKRKPKSASSTTAKRAVKKDEA